VLAVGSVGYIKDPDRTALQTLHLGYKTNQFML
jgi:hypothetical protein